MNSIRLPNDEEGRWPERFEGEFVPPRLGHYNDPIRIAGPGTLEVREHAIVVEGYEDQGSCLAVVLGTLGVIFGMGLVGGLVATFVGLEAGFVAGAAGGLASALVRRRRGAEGVTGVLVGVATSSETGYDESNAVTHCFPLYAVERVEGPGEQNLPAPVAADVRIVVEGTSPEGVIHFTPDGTAEWVEATVRDAAAG